MLVSWVRLWLLAWLLPLMAAAACANAGPAATTESKQPGQLSVVAAFYPFQFVAQRVAGDHATVSSLTPPGAEPHDLELTPRQVASLTTASLVIYQNGFQPAVDEAVVQSGAPDVIDISKIIPLRPLPATEDDHEYDHGPKEPGEGHLDPHVWLDPTSVSRIARTVQERLSTLDPDHAADYAHNAAALDEELGSLDRSLRRGLARCVRTEFITTHAAFGYLAKRYHLTQIGVSGLSPDAEPSPARIAEVQREATDHKLTTIFYETLVSPAVAEAIARDLGLATDVLDPVEGITSQSRGQDYLSVMYANLAALRKAGGCS
ncbi:MAG TPA: metal ABC transporter substrate-binding protein [Propionibacteriaceae bacterium]|nr:metal ABC transporter substrate-binding protein [Propionibacteriaceae bacterium]